MIQGIKNMIDRQQQEAKKEKELQQKEIQELFSQKEAVHITVTGKVQGVFYREYIKQKAQQLEITGYARNKPDGTVEITAEGEKTKLRQFITECQKGSPLSKIQKLDYTWQEYTGKYKEFYKE